MDATSTDRIEKQILLRAPRTRVWRALTDAKEFGKWFGVEMAGPFAPGARVQGKVLHEEYQDYTMDIVIDRMEPERLFSWRWHPAAKRGVDYSSEPTTLVVFELESRSEGTLLKVVESGFDQLPLARRAGAFRDNEEGWATQMEAIAQYVGKAA